MANFNEDSQLAAIAGTDKAFSLSSAIQALGNNLVKGEEALQQAMTKLQASASPSPADLAVMQFRINKWTLNFNMFSSMVKSVKDVAQSTIQKI